MKLYKINEYTMINLEKFDTISCSKGNLLNFFIGTEVFEKRFDTEVELNAAFLDLFQTFRVDIKQ